MQTKTNNVLVRPRSETTMLSKNGLVAMAAGILILGLPMAVQATMLTWAMEGTIQSVSDPLGLIGFAQVGERVRYTFTFDSEAPNNSYPPGQSGLYSGLSATFLVGSESIAAQPPTIDIQRGSYQHQSDAFNVSSWLDVGGIPGFAIFSLFDTTGTALPSPDLPQDPYPVSSFGWTDFSFSFNGPPSPNNPSGTLLAFNGPVDSFYAIPEPGSLLLLALGGVALSLRHRKND